MEEAASCTCRLFHSSKRGRGRTFSEVQTILAHGRGGAVERECTVGTVKGAEPYEKKSASRERHGELFA